MGIKMRFGGHEKFFIRKGWLHKGVKNVIDNPEVFISKSPLPTDVLGLGNNMVKSLRYWLQTVGLTQEPRTGKRIQEVTKMGQIIYQNDVYFEELGSLWLMHYHLAKNVQNATSWYFFFNEFQMQEFKKEDFCLALKKYVRMHSDVEVSDNSIENDFDCLMNTYISRTKSNPGKVHPENNIDCPLGELNLLDIKDKRERIYTKVIPPKASIHPLIALAIIVDIAEHQEINMQSLLKDKNSIGKLLNLDMISLLELLNKIEKMGYISVIRTAGLDVVRLKSNWTFYDCIEHYYQMINHVDGE